MANPFPFSAGDVLTAADMNDIGAWQTYTPALTSSGTDPTLGSGAVQTGNYVEVNGLVIMSVIITFGSGSSAGTGDYRISLPVTADTTNNSLAHGSAWVYDSSVTKGYSCFPQVSATSYLGLLIGVGTSPVTVTNSAPFAWTGSDQIRVTAIYRGA